MVSSGKIQDIDEKTLLKFNKALNKSEGWYNNIGRYYDVTGFADEDPGAGSSVTYFYHPDNKVVPPDERGVVSTNAFIAKSRFLKTFGLKTQKYKGKAKDSVVTRARTAMSKYLHNSAKGSIGMKVSKYFGSDSKTILKISKRISKVVGMIKALGADGPTPESIAEEYKLK